MSEDRLVPELDISEEDVLNAMQRIPGYLDISTGDFRALYGLAWEYAQERLFAHLRVEHLMRKEIEPVRQDHRLDEAARIMAGQEMKSIAVVDDADRVVGVLTESDFLRRLNAGSFLELMLRLIGDPTGITHRCHETHVSEAMSAPAVTVQVQADYHQLMAAFGRCGGRALPVVGQDRRLCGLLLRKDFIGACTLRSLE